MRRRHNLRYIKIPEHYKKIFRHLLFSQEGRFFVFQRVLDFHNLF